MVAEITKHFSMLLEGVFSELWNISLHDRDLLQ
jgi:hypothetical protein